MQVAVTQEGKFQGYVSLDDAEGFFIRMTWLEMLYRLPDGRWVHVFEDPPEPTGCLAGQLLSEHQALAHLATRAEYDHLPHLLRCPWFQPYLGLPPWPAPSVSEGQPSAFSADQPTPPPLDLSKEDLAKALLMRDPGMSNADLARRLGVHPSTVGRWTWLQQYREMLKESRAERVRGFRTADGSVEAETWEEVMDPDELDRYYRGEMK
jgi:hypothetical protein